MAISNRDSSAPMFRSRVQFNPGILDEDLDTDLIMHDRGANQFLGDYANHHDGQSTVGPRGNRVQDGSLALLGTHSNIGRPTRAQPVGGSNG